MSLVRARARGNRGEEGQVTTLKPIVFHLCVFMLYSESHLLSAYSSQF